MADQESTIQDWENQLPTFSGQAFMEASRKALAAGQSVLQTDQGVIYRFFPDGTRQFVKKIEASTPVTLGQKIRIR
jgi:hypothetical protein